MPRVSVVPGPVVTTGIDVFGLPSLSPLVAAIATTAPATRATRRREASAAQSQSGDSRDHISVLRIPRMAKGGGRRWPHSRQYSWKGSCGAPQRGQIPVRGGGPTGGISGSIGG